MDALVKDDKQNEGRDIPASVPKHGHEQDDVWAKLSAAGRAHRGALAALAQAQRAAAGEAEGIRRRAREGAGKTKMMRERAKVSGACTYASIIPHLHACTHAHARMTARMYYSPTHTCAYGLFVIVRIIIPNPNITYHHHHHHLASSPSPLTSQSSLPFSSPSPRLASMLLL
eukprot:jgi/Chlat1/474/Chrsp103S00978